MQTKNLPAAALCAGILILLSCVDLQATQYFSQGATGDPTQPTSWTNSAGANPANFTSGDTFIILNGCNFTIPVATTWAVNATTAGTAATVQINATGALTFQLASGQGGTLQIGGNLVQTAASASVGLVGTATTVTGTVEFTSSGTWTGSGDVSNIKLSVIVDAGATLDASGLSTGFKLKSSNTIGITVNGTLITSTLTISGNGNGSASFTLGSTGTLITANTAGVPAIFTGFSAGKITLPTTANYTFNGTAAQVTGTTANNATMPAEVNNLTVSNNAGVTLSQAMQVDSTLAFTAGVVTGNVTLGSSATINGGSSTAYLNGQLTVPFAAPTLASFTFPIGTASAYSPIGVTNFTDTGNGTLTASATVGQNPNQPSSGIDLTEYINRYWTLTGSGFNSPTYDFTGTFLAGDILNGANPATLIVSKWDGTSWAAPSGSSSLGSPTYTVTGTGFNTDFGQFSAGETAFLPSVIATTVSAITNSSATLGATVYANNGSTINNYGIVWGTSPNPTLANNMISAGSSPTLGSPYAVNATGLPVATTVYYRGFATSGNGTGYSTNSSFLTLANQPTVQASGVVGTALQNGNLNFSWVRGNGTNCIVLVSAGSPVSSPPVSGTVYTANAAFGSGSQIGSGNYVAFIGTGTNVTITGLSTSTTYYVAVYEFIGTGGSQNYLTPPATGSQTTVTTPIASLTWTGSADHNWNNTNNWNPMLIPGVGTIAIIPNVANQPLYTNLMVAASFGNMTNAGILTIATNGFNSGVVFMNRAGGTATANAQIIITNNGVMGVTGNICLASNSIITVYSGGSLTASGQLVIGCNVTNGANSSATPGSFGTVTNNGGNITVGSTALNPGNGSITGGNLFVISGGTSTLGSVTIARSSAGSGGYNTLGSEGLMIYGGQVNMSGLNVGGGNGNSFLTALISGGTVTNKGSVLVNQGSSARGSRFLQTGGLFVVTNLANPNPTVSGSLNVYSVTGGTNVVGGIVFGAAAGAGSVFFTNSAAIYVGSQGISANSGITLTTALNGGGLFGASAPWTGSAAMTLNSGSFTFQTADLNNNPNSITLSGALNGNGGLIVTGGGGLTLNTANTYAGSTLIAAGSLALGSSGSLTSPQIMVGSNATFNVTALGSAYTLNSGQTLAGVGTVSGTVTAGTSSTIYPGSNSLTGTLTLSSGLTETGGAIDEFNLSSNPSGPNNDLVAVTGNLTLSGTNTIFIAGSVPSGLNYTLIQYSGLLTGGVTNFNLAGAVGYLTNIANTIALHTLATTRGPTNTVWVGNPSNENWDTAVSTNWLNPTNGLDFFVSGDSPLFGNQGKTNLNVNVGTLVTPGTVTINTASNYVFAGAGSIGGTASLVVSNGTLTMLLTNNYTGPTILDGGILSTPSIAIGGSPSGIGAASSSPGNLIFNGGTFAYTGSSAGTDHGITLTNAGGTIDVTNGTTLTLNGALTGNGGLTLIDSGTLVLTSGNGYSGNTTVSNGVLNLNNTTAAGSGPIDLAGGTLDLTVGGQPTFANALTVVANSTLLSAGGNNNIMSGQWTGGSNVTVSVVINGTGTFSVSGDMTNFYGTVELGNDTGFFRFNGGNNNTQFGGTNATFDVGTNTATLEARNPGTMGIGALEGGPSTFVKGPSSVTGTLIWAIGSSTNNPSTAYYGTIENSAANEISSVTKIGTGTLTLAGQNTYTGNTIISSGTLALTNDPFATSEDGSIGDSATINVVTGAILDVSGRSDGTFQLANSTTQMLEGRGTINGSLNVGSSGTVVPGGGPGGNTGTLTVTNAVTLTGTAWMKLNRGNTPNSDQLVSSLSTITYGGTLVVTNIGSGLHAGDTFTLFSGGGLSGGNFSTVVLPNYYVWNTGNLGVNGSISVTSLAPLPAITNVDFSGLSGGMITLNVANGAPNGPVVVLTSTNLLGAWTPVVTNSFYSDGTLSQSVTVDPTLPQSFYVLQAY